MSELSVSHPQYLVDLVDLPADWMVGSINGGNLGSNVEAISRTAGLIVDSIQPVTGVAKSCTDSRLRLGLFAGEEVIRIKNLLPGGAVDETSYDATQIWMDVDGTVVEPAIPHVRSQLVGGVLMTALAVAETIPGFFPDSFQSPLERMGFIGTMLRRNGEPILAHNDCGAAKNHPAVMSNIVRFAGNPAFLSRAELFLPDNAYDERVAQRVVKNIADHKKSYYVGYTAHLAGAVAISHHGSAAVERLKTVGGNSHGHQESAIVRLHQDVGDVALSPNVLAEAGLQAFSVNDSALHEVAGIVAAEAASRLPGNEEDFLVHTLHAAEMYTNAGHGTLADKLLTMSVRLAA